MRAVILAAGAGTRLRPLTDNRPKCLIEMEGVSLLDRQRAVLTSAGISEIFVVTGFLANQIASKGYRTFHNPDYSTTNMVESLFRARLCLSGDRDLLIAYGDIVYEPRVLDALLRCSAPVCVAVDKAWRPFWEVRMAQPLQDLETLKLDRHGRIIELGKRPKSYDDIEGQYIGLIKVRADHVKKLTQTYHSMDRLELYDGRPFREMFMTSFLQNLINLGWTVKAVGIENGWLEIDTLEDLKRYEDLARTGELVRFYNPECIEGAGSLPSKCPDEPNP
jgi:L-glutamine-phosphate cytidylyltransferase